MALTLYIYIIRYSTIKTVQIQINKSDKLALININYDYLRVFKVKYIQNKVFQKTITTITYIFKIKKMVKIRTLSFVGKIQLNSSQK